MNRLPALLFAIALSAPAEAMTSTEHLCAALDSLRLEAERTHRPQQIVFIKQEAMSSACMREAKNEILSTFCSAALRAVGVEFTHGFPWLIHDCLVRRGIRPAVETSVQYTGMVAHRRRLIHLVGHWPGGTRIEILFLGLGDFGDEPEFRGYWGRYKMIVSAAG